MPCERTFLLRTQTTNSCQHLNYSSLGRRLRLFWSPISAATMTIFSAIPNWSHNATVSSKNCPSSMPETNSEQSFRYIGMKKQCSTTHLQRHIVPVYHKLFAVSRSQLLYVDSRRAKQLAWSCISVTCVFDDDAGFLEKYWKWIYCLTRLRIQSIPIGSLCVCSRDSFKSAYCRKVHY